MEILLIITFIIIYKYLKKQESFIPIQKLPISNNKNLRYNKEAFTELYHSLKK